MLNEKWSFTIEVNDANLAAVPAGAREFFFNDANVTDLDSVAGKKGAGNDECIVYNEFELDKDTQVIFGAGADWWFDAWLNGENIYSTLPSGNGDPIFSTENHAFFAQCKKGKNLLAVKVRRGMATWKFAFGELDMDAYDPVFPLTITLDPQKITGKVKPMNAVNNGPNKARGDQTRGNLKLWQEARIPFARNHDASAWTGYGGAHTVDVHNIFPDFSKDVNDPASYDFTLTDRYIETTFEGGTETFYRLGSKIEHAPKKYGTKVPPDFQKWAEICEHIIRHYNEGWADGFKYNLQYWEIWNEPDLSSNQTDKKTWQGTDEEFFELYKTAASHLKKCFPDLKIGGPALAGNWGWAEQFFDFMTAGNSRVPIDFFSWHCYTTNPSVIAARSDHARKLLDSYGYTNAENILNEYNYVRGWTDEFVYSIKQIIGLKGAAFIAGCMCSGQNSALDMLMYYDARPSAFNGLFDFYTYAPLKTYYTFIAWKNLVELGNTFAVNTHRKRGIYAVGATDGKGKSALLISRYFEQDDLPGDLPITIDAAGLDFAKAKLCIIDDERDLEQVPFWSDGAGKIFFSMKANTVAYLEF